MNGNGPLSFEAIIQDVNFMSWLTAAERRVMGFSNTVVKQSDLLDKSLSRIGKTPTGLSNVSRDANAAGLSLQRLGQYAVGAFAFSQLQDLPMQLLRVRGEFQQLEISLTTFLKSKEKAGTLLAEIVKAASETQFSFRDIASGAKQLLAYGSSANTVVQELRMLGDVAAGVSAPITDIIYLYGTLRSQGKAYAVDIRQFASRGIPIYEELSKVLKINVSQVNDFVTAGKVGFKEVEQAFKNMTSGAGLFAGLTAAQSKSLTGLKERLSDAYDVMLNDIGKKNQKILQDSIQTATYVVEHYQDVVDILEVVAGAYGGYKAAVLLTSVVEKERATIAAFVAASVDKQAAAQIASAAASLPAMRAQVSVLAAQKAEVVALATAKSVALKVAQQELITAQAAVVANANILDAGKRNASIRAAEIAENNVIAAQEAATLTRKQAIAVSSEFYATKAALGAVAVTAQATAETRLTAAQAFRASVTQRLTALQTALNASMFANPVVLAITAIAALTAAYYAFREEIIEIKSAQDLLKDSTSEANTKFSAQKAEITSLVNVVKNQTVAESQRLEAYRKLKEIAPALIRDLDFQKAKTADLTKETNLYLQSLEKRIRLESITSRYKDAFDQDSKINTEVDAATKDYLRKKKTADALSKSQLGGGTFGVVNGAAQQAAKEASDALEKLNRLSSQSIESRKVIKDIGAEIEGVYKGRSKEAIQAHITQLEIAARAITDKLSPAYKLNEETLNSWKKQLTDLNSVQTTTISFTDQLAASETASALRIAKGLATTDNQLDELQKKVKERAGDATRGGKEKADLEQLSREIDRLQGKKTKSEKDAEKVGPYGSLSYWESVIKKIEEANSKTDIKNKPALVKNQVALENAKQKAEEIRAILEAPVDSLQHYERQLASAQKKLELTPKTDTAEIDRQKQIIVGAQNEIENIRKLTAVRSLEDEISEKKALYELYYKWVGEYGKVAADKQFDTLLSSGQSFIEFLNSEITKLETQRDKGKLNEKDTKNLGSLLAQRDEATGKKTPIDVFNESLEKAQRESSNLADYLVKLKQKQDDLGKPTNTSNDIAIRKRLAEEVVKTQADLQSRLREFLTSYASSGEQQLAIQKDFAEKRAALDQKYNGQKGDDYKASLKIINDAEKQALQDYQQRKLEEGEAYKETTKVILEVGEKRAAIEIQRQRAVVADAKQQFGVNSEAYKKALETLNALIDKNGGTPAQKILGTYSQVFDQIGQGLSQLGGEAGKTGDILTGLAGNIDLVSQAMDKNLDKGKRMAIAIQGFVGLITSITEAAQQRKKVETEYYNTVISQQERYNLLLNEQIGLRSKGQETIFLRNYSSELKDNYAQLADAQDKYQQSLDKLKGGKAKSGLKDYFDSGAFLKSVGSGAAAGAAIIPVIGGLVGGIVGGIAGLFTSNKKAEEFGDLLTLYPKLIQKSRDGIDEINVSLAQSLIDSGSLDDKTKELVQSTIDWQKQVEAARQAIKAIVSDLVGDLGTRLGDGLVQAFKDGTDAALSFKSTLEDVLESFVTKVIYTKILAPYLKAFEDDVTKSLDTEHGGDGSIIDDIGKFYKNTGKIIPQINDALQTAQDDAKNIGLDILKNKPSTSGTRNPNSMGQVIQASVTEATANILTGQINAMRITVADTNAAMRQSLLFLSGIEQNTARIAKTNELLDSLDRNIRIIASDPYRGMGGMPK